MNVTLTTGLLISVFAFGIAFSPRQQESEPPILQKQSSNSNNIETYFPTLLENETDEEKAKIKAHLLKGWPVLSLRAQMSRAMPRLDYYSNLAFDESNSSSAPYFLCQFRLDIRNKSEVFALQYDRETGEARIFAANKWQNYTTWKTEKLKSLKKQFS